MAGCRPLTPDEIRRATGAFAGRYAPRNRCLFVLGCVAGFRIREMLSLRVRDVVTPSGVVRASVEVARRNMKGKRCGRLVYLAPEAQRAILDQTRALEWPGREVCLFRVQGKENRPISYTQARRVILAGMESAGVPLEKVGTHSMRKTFANELYDYMLELVAEGKGVDPFMEVSAALGHDDPKSTKHYLAFRDENRRAGIRRMGALHA